MRRWSTAVFAAIAVALIAPSPPASAQSAAPFNWTGFYAGGNVGWMWSTAQTTVAAPGAAEQFPLTLTLPPLASTDTTHPSGVTGGVQVGYEWQGVSSWIAGLEADIQASDQSASNAVSTIITNGPANCIAKVISNCSLTTAVSHTGAIDWFGTVRGRLGYAIWPGLMVYGTGGLAYGRVNTSAIATQTAATCAGAGCVPSSILTIMSNADGSAMRTGWTAGGGITGIVPNNPRLTWKVEYLHVDLGSNNLSFVTTTILVPGFGGTGVVSVSSRFTDDIVRVGADYHFSRSCRARRRRNLLHPTIGPAFMSAAMSAGCGARRTPRWPRPVRLLSFRMQRLQYRRSQSPIRRIQAA